MTLPGWFVGLNQDEINAIPYNQLPIAECASCGEDMAVYEVGQTTHPTCGDGV